MCNIMTLEFLFEDLKPVKIRVCVAYGVLIEKKILQYVFMKDECIPKLMLKTREFIIS